MVKDWNEVPLMVRDAETYNSFKRQNSKGVPPANPLYYHGKRLASVHQTRIRMGCSALKKHLFDRIHVVDTPTCACGTEDEAPYHFFFVCPFMLPKELQCWRTCIQLSTHLLR